MDNISMQIIGGADGPTSVFMSEFLNTQISIAIIVAGIILSVLGLKLMRVLSALVGFLLGAGVGAAIGMIAGLSNGVTLALTIGLGIVIAVLSGILRKAGIFISVFVYVFAVLSSLIPLSALIVTIVELVVGIVIAILAVKYMEPAVVIASSLAGGMIAGPAIWGLVGFEEKIWIGYVIGLVISILGMMIQMFMHSKKLAKHEKIYSKKVKETDSRESEVEKARMLLDDDFDDDGEE